MKILHLACASIFAAAVIIIPACGGNKKSEAEIQRENWLLSLNDSIAGYKARIESAQASLNSIQAEIGGMISDFDHVSNPRLVEGYYIYKGWNTRYPMKQTALVARITEGEGFELIATLTGAHFNRISVSNGTQSIESAIVPHDQALNYRAGDLNTVCFTGGAADSIGNLIANSPAYKITVTFIDGKKTGSLTLPADQKEMVAQTWKLSNAQNSSHALEREIPLLSRRIDICRQMLNTNDSTLDKGN